MSTKKTWTLYLGLTSLFCMNCFQNREKLLGHYCILIFEFSRCEVISGRSVDDHFRITHPVCFTGGATEFFSMRFSQLVSYSGYSGVLGFGHLFHNCQASSDCHSRWTWPKELGGTMIQK